MISRNCTSAVVTYEWRCKKCKAKTELSLRSFPSEEIPNPTIPDGWMRVGDLFYCPDHKVTILVDGEVAA